MIVCAHQPCYLAGSSVLAKVAHADAVIWLDDVRFTAPGYCNRNRLPDGTWLAVPVDRENHRTPIREVKIGHDGGDWQHRHQSLLRERYQNEPHFDSYPLSLIAAAEAGTRLVDLNLGLLEWAINALGLSTREFRQSDYPTPGGDLSSKLVRAVKAVGGTAYLSGPSTRLDPAVFEEAGVELLFFRYAGENPSVIDPLLRTGKLPTRPVQEVNVA